MARKKTGRSSAVSKKVSGRAGTGKFKRSTGRARAVAAPRPSGHELVPVVCSDCFEEFSFDTGIRSDSLVCPVCEHSADRPDDALLHRISGHRRAEKTNFAICLALLLVGLAGFGVWGAMIRDPMNALEGGTFWAPAGLALLSALALAGFTFKYEGNRWEVYF